MQEFKEKYIYPTIVNKEVEEESMLWWIQNKLSLHSYDDEDNNESDDENRDEYEEENEKDTESQDKDVGSNKIDDTKNVDESINKSSVSS